MPLPITIPRLGWSMEEGVFGEWLKAPGELVRAGDMIFLLEGEKAATEIESFDSGYLCIPADAPQPGTTVKVGATIGFLLAEGEPAPSSVGRPESNSFTAQPQAPASCGRVAPQLNAESRSDSPTLRLGHALESIALPSTPRAAGPAARRMARELGIDLNAVFTPDPTGRVLCEDVQRTAALRNVRPSVGTIARQPIATHRNPASQTPRRGTQHRLDSPRRNRSRRPHPRTRCSDRTDRANPLATADCQLPTPVPRATPDRTRPFRPGIETSSDPRTANDGRTASSRLGHAHHQDQRGGDGRAS